MNINVLFKRICKRIGFGINLIHGSQGGINMCGEKID